MFICSYVKRLCTIQVCRESLFTNWAYVVQCVLIKQLHINCHIPIIGAQYKYCQSDYNIPFIENNALLSTNQYASFLSFKKCFNYVSYNEYRKINNLVQQITIKI